MVAWLSDIAALIEDAATLGDTSDAANRASRDRHILEGDVGRRC